jgi:hypothetical protein
VGWLVGGFFSRYKKDRKSFALHVLWQRPTRSFIF